MFDYQRVCAYLALFLGAFFIYVHCCLQCLASTSQISSLSPSDNTSFSFYVSLFVAFGSKHVIIDITIVATMYSISTGVTIGVLSFYSLCKELISLVYFEY